jgi:hypothetical protein
MRKVTISYPCTTAERFFIEKAVELTHRYTIETYRLRINNPYSILKELSEVIVDINASRLKNREYAHTLLAETEQLLKAENELKFINVNKTHFKKIINPRQAGQKADFNHVLYSANLILADNKKYALTLFTAIEAEIARLNSVSTGLQVSDLELLDRLTGYFFISLKDKGYSKVYLHRFVRAVLGAKRLQQFSAGFQILRSLLDRPNEKFTVIVALEISTSQRKIIKLLSEEFRFVSRKQQIRFTQFTNTVIKDFFDANDDCMHIGTSIEAKDYYAATNQARERLMNELDILHMGLSGESLSIAEECAVIGSKEPARSHTQRFNYHIDGYYNSSEKLYSAFSKKIHELSAKKVSHTSRAKLYSGLRYLRLGSEASELENKLLNYWIGIEFLFSVYEADSYTIGRLRQYFKKCHSIGYLKKLLLDFHQSIKEFGLASAIAGYHAKLDYLKDTVTYDAVIAQLHQFPLIAFRAHTLKKYRQDPKRLHDALFKHQSNIDWNLNRLYRIRNEIVHNAALKSNIESLIAHLRGYLVFTLNAIIDFFNDAPIDIDADRELTIDDYYILQEIKLDNLLAGQADLFDKLLEQRYPLQYLT